MIAEEMNECFPLTGASIITSGGNTSALLALNTNLSRPGSSAEVVAALSTGGYYLSPYCVFVIGDLFVTS